MIIVLNHHLPKHSVCCKCCQLLHAGSKNRTIKCCIKDFIASQEVIRTRDFIDIVHLVAESHFDLAGLKTNRRSTTGYFTMVGRRNLVSWKSMKQLVVSKSNFEVEYRAMVYETCESSWLWILLYELGFICKGPMVLVFVLLQHNRLR